MKVLTGIDLPAGSPGGSVELLRDLYLAPDRVIDADVFMLPGKMPHDRGDQPVILLKGAEKHLEGPGFWSYVDALVTQIRRRFAPEDYGLVHLQHLAFGATPSLLRAFPDHRRIALVHGTDLLFAAACPTQAEVLREAAVRADVIAVPTAAMADALDRLAGVDRGKIVHLPWGIPDRLITDPPPRRVNDDDELRLLYAGRLTAEKGAADLLDVVGRLPGVRLSMAAPVAEYQALCATRDMSAIRYLGWLTRPQLWDAFGEHHALVVPSTRLEAFGLVAIEAQACGLPVLFRSVPGLAEVMGDSGLRIDFAGDPGGAAAQVARLQRDRSALADLRTRGRGNAARFPLSRAAVELAALSGSLAV